uniref:G-protein coupled receptors family 1 profile domain-containing protein n=1 Tax=Branchiostoma floridae TaxID=7739 RepID=C3Y4W2_BRAFL|eukprot:XP_002608759.1 hypothetical protein BRAFLDRAFT_73980 [Branchiostoma floridae]
MWLNDSLNVSATGNISGSDDVISGAEDMSQTGEYTTGQMIAIVVIVSMVMTLIIVGNLAVIFLYVFGKRIKKPRNAFIVSLAVSDVMVGATIMPFSLSNELLGYWAFGKILCDLWLAFDVIACTASIYNLCAIALDRYWSVTDATYVQYKSRDRMKMMLSAVWISALAVGIPPLVGWVEEQDWEHEEKPSCELRTLPEYVFFSVALSFWVPLLLMTAIYFVVLRETKKRFSARLQRRKISEEVAKRYGLRRSRRGVIPGANAANNARKATLPARSTNSSKESNANRHRCSIMTPSTQRVSPKLNHIVRVTSTYVRDVSSVNEFSDFHLDILYEETESKTKAPNSISDHNTDNTFNVVSHDSKANGQTNALAPAVKKNICDYKGEVVSQVCPDANRKPGSNSFETKSTPRDDSVEVGKSGYVGCIPLPVPGTLRVHAPSLKQETRLNLVIGLVIGAFAACWLPFFSVYPLSVVTKSLVPATLFKFCFWLGYCNSFLNPIIYTACNQDFHEAFSEVRRKFFKRNRDGKGLVIGRNK